MSKLVTSEDFQSKVLDATNPVLVDFFAVWCPPCQRIAPVIDEIAAEVEGSAEVYKLNIDENPDIASKYGVMSVPTFIVFKNGEAVNQMVGAYPKANILAMLQ